MANDTVWYVSGEGVEILAANLPTEAAQDVAQAVRERIADDYVSARKNHPAYGGIAGKMALMREAVNVSKRTVTVLPSYVSAPVAGSVTR